MAVHLLDEYETKHYSVRVTCGRQKQAISDEEIAKLMVKQDKIREKIMETNPLYARLYRKRKGMIDG